jgi:hypothetical protein
MRRLFSLLLGAALLIGGATLGLRTDSASAADHHELNQTPIVFLNATDDDTAPFSEAQSLYKTPAGSKRFYAIKAKGHHFEGGQQEFYRDLDMELSR